MEWINAKDELPDTGQKVVVIDKHIRAEYRDRDMAMAWLRNNPERFANLYETAFRGRKWMVSNSYGGVGHVSELDEVTHWMPLPSPPNESD